MIPPSAAADDAPSNNAGSSAKGKNNGAAPASSVYGGVAPMQDAGHAETDSEGRMVIAPLSCSLVETSAVVELRANTLIARAYGRESIEEGYHCRYGVSSAFAAELEQGDLRVTGWDEEGEIRAVELVTHPFFVATLFQHERHALDGRPAPLVQAFLRAAAQ